MRYLATLFFCGALLLVLTTSLLRLGDDPAPDAPAVTFAQSSDKVEAYDFVEVTVTVPTATTRNPFTDVAVTGQFNRVEGGKPLAVEGFCDSADGGTCRIRFMPSRPGKHTYKRLPPQPVAGPLRRTDLRRSSVFHSESRGDRPAG
jgi:hypothetical protein